MNVALISLACMFLGALIGVLLREFLPEHHMSTESRDVIKLGTGLIATQAALVLGLMVSSAKTQFDSVSNSLTEGAASRILLDRNLAHYGPEAQPVRDQLRAAFTAKIEHLWPKAGSHKRATDDDDVTDMENVGDLLRALTPANEPQKILKDRVLELYGKGNEHRWELNSKVHAEVPMVFIVVLIFWFTVLFSAFGVLAPNNVTVKVVMFLCMMSVAAGIMLILDVARPFEGVIRVSRAPYDNALRSLGR